LPFFRLAFAGDVLYFGNEGKTKDERKKPPLSILKPNSMARTTKNIILHQLRGQIDNQSANNYVYDRIGNLVSDAAENLDEVRWTVYGKINRIMKSNGGSTVIDYGYDPGGNRTYKKVNTNDTITNTFYVRDAQGNVLAIYSKKQEEGLKWDEQHLYGSSRLGMWRYDTLVPTVAPVVGEATSIYDSLLLGSRSYELSNHLGNVLSTISDKKIGNDSSGVVNYYLAEVLSQNDYYPFGMLMPGRKYAAENGYRYGFNGKENDNEVKGEGNQQDYGMRIYDPRLGRFLSVDPLSKSFPYYSPYQYAGNMPIYAIDLDGQEPIGALRRVSKGTTRIMGVSWEAQYNAVSHTVGIANGVAVDPTGNVLVFTQAGGLAASIDFLQGGKSSDVSVGINIGFSVYNDRVSRLEDLLGSGKTLSGGVGFLSGGAELSDDLEIQGATVQLSLSFGSSLLAGDAGAQNTNTTGTIFAKAEYDNFKTALSTYKSQAIKDAEQYNFNQAVLAGEEYGKENFPYYAKAVWQAKGSGFDASYEEVGKDRVEIVYKTSFTIYAQQSVVASKGLAGDYTKETKVEKTYRSGIFLTKDEKGNYISEKYQYQMSQKKNE